MKPGQADLHVHTTASDGTASPAQVVREAQELGLAALAITDHDAVAGVRPAQTAGREAPVEVIAGVEISTRFDPEAEGQEQVATRGSVLGTGEAHILGYFIDVRSRQLTDLLEDLASGRRSRGKEMVERLNEAGVQLDWELVLEEAGDGSVGRPHVARALVGAGLCRDQRQAFSVYLVPGRPGFVPRHKIHPREAAEAIDRAGGVSVLAHPGILNPLPDWRLLGQWGIRGLEVLHPAHSPAQTRAYRQTAAQRGLLPTGGSDHHGPGDERRLGGVTVPESWVEALRVEGAGSRE